MRAYKFRIYPNREQEVKLTFTLDHCRYLYNTALQQRRDAYKSAGVNVTYYDQSSELTLIKQQFVEYKGINSRVLLDVISRVDTAFSNFFRRIKTGVRCGYPRFQSKDGYASISCSQSGFGIKGGKIRFSKIGLIKTKFHREIPEHCRIKTCTIKKERTKWYVVFVCDSKILHPTKKQINTSVGIDLGITDFAVLSNGQEIANPKYLKQSEGKLTAIQSKYSKGKSRKIKRQLIGLHRKIANQRKDFQHKLSHSLINNFDLIVHENLNIKGMVQDEKYHLQKHIHDAAWGQFIHMIKYKAESAGTTVIGVNPRGTTIRCSRCDTEVPKDLSERSHKCPECGFEASRDHNAALNIHKLGISLVGISGRINHLRL